MFFEQRGLLKLCPYLGVSAIGDSAVPCIFKYVLLDNNTVISTHTRGDSVLTSFPLCIGLS